MNRIRCLCGLRLKQGADLKNLRGHHIERVPGANCPIHARNDESRERALRAVVASQWAALMLVADPYVEECFQEDCADLDCSDPVHCVWYLSVWDEDVAKVFARMPPAVSIVDDL